MKKLNLTSPNLFNLDKDVILSICNELYPKYENIMITEDKFRFSAFYPHITIWILVRETFGNFKNPILTIEDLKFLYEEYMLTEVKGIFMTGLNEFLDLKFGEIKPIC